MKEDKKKIYPEELRCKINGKKPQNFSLPSPYIEDKINLFKAMTVFCKH